MTLHRKFQIQPKDGYSLDFDEILDWFTENKKEFLVLKEAELPQKKPSKSQKIPVLEFYQTYLQMSFPNMKSMNSIQNELHTLQTNCKIVPIKTTKGRKKKIELFIEQAISFPIVQKEGNDSVLLTFKEKCAIYTQKKDAEALIERKNFEETLRTKYDKDLTSSKRVLEEEITELKTQVNGALKLLDIQKNVLQGLEVSSKTARKILDLPETASQKDISTTWTKQLLFIHPDKVAWIYGTETPLFKYYKIFSQWVIDAKAVLEQKTIIIDP